MKSRLKRASEAYSNMTAWQAVITLMEGGLISSSSYKARERVIEIAKYERNKQYSHYESLVEEDNENKNSTTS